jgi:hypothetical protein
MYESYTTLSSYTASDEYPSEAPYMMMGCRGPMRCEKHEFVHLDSAMYDLFTKGPSLAIRGCAQGGVTPGELNIVPCL